MRVRGVKHLKGYKLEIVFGDGSVKVVDLENRVKKSSGIFLSLKNPDYFKQVALDGVGLGICWPNGADICPDVLYSMGMQNSS